MRRFTQRQLVWSVGWWMPHVAIQLGAAMSSSKRAAAGEYTSPTAEYLRHRSRGDASHIAAEALPSSRSSSTMTKGPPTLKHSEAAQVSEFLQNALTARSISGFQDNCEALVALEKRKLYAVHRPTSPLNPNDYIKLFHCAKSLLRSSPLTSLHHPVVVQLLDVFLELWGKPRSPHHITTAVHSIESNTWQSDHDEIMCCTVAAALAALPPRDALQVMSACCIDNALVELYEEEQRTAAQGQVPPQRGSAEHTASVMLWCLEHSDARSQKALALQAVKRAAAGTTRPPPQVSTFLQRIRTAQHPSVVAVMVSSMILLGSSSSKLLALALCDAYVTAWVKVRGVDRDALYGVIRAATEAAAVVGDSELVARFIFVLFRVKGVLCAPTTTSIPEATSSPSLSMAVRNWWQSSPSTVSGLLSESALDAEFDETVAVLLKDTMHAAIKERGMAHAEALFESLRTGCTWKAVANMSLELLDGLAKENVRPTAANANIEVRSEEDTLQRRALAVLGKMAMVYPRHPTSVDEKRMTLAVRRAMQLHFEYIPVPVPPSQPTSIGTTTGHTGGGVLYWPRPKNPIRSLELYERLPRGNLMRRDVRYLALSAASFLQGNDSSERFASLLQEEEEEVLNNTHAVTVNASSSSSLLLAATWTLGCLCWDASGIDAARWREVVLRPANEESDLPILRGASLEWVRRIFSVPTSRLAVLYIACGVLQRGGCPPLRHPRKLLDWCELELSAAPTEVKRGTADVIAASLIQQPPWKMEGSDADALEEYRQRLLQTCSQYLIGCNVEKKNSVTCVVPPQRRRGEAGLGLRLQPPSTFNPAVGGGSVAPEDSIVLLHSSVAAIPEAHFLDFVRGTGLGEKRHCHVVVPWELLSMSQPAAGAVQLRHLLRSLLHNFPKMCVAVVVEEFGAPSVDAELSHQCVAGAARAMLKKTTSSVTVWADNVAVASAELKSVLASFPGRVDVTGPTTGQSNNESLRDLQQLLSLDPSQRLLRSVPQHTTNQYTTNRAGTETRKEPDGGLRSSSKPGAVGGLRRNSSLHSQQQQQKK
ncbi:Hypothetical protein, putative [Bodo saltans]|uniref:GPI-anchored surface protein n=1 Tax=Bodo saltans TaxID=75058 RepID=A0A0S4JM57_BODSA|nr:Hypothetical protein, putative [Bodo saltans]|eukprot:CUG91221.1 Hypothetical protein, putative [Bodo saltans]